MNIRIDDPIHNPFHNRFHVPVHSRVDEMHASTHMIWLHSPLQLDQKEKADQHRRPFGSTLAGAFLLVLVVLFSAALLAS